MNEAADMSDVQADAPEDLGEDMSEEMGAETQMAAQMDTSEQGGMSAEAGMSAQAERPIESEAAYQVGYGQPPVASRFRKGQSGNPTGEARSNMRRRKTSALPYEAVLGRTMRVREDGAVRRVSAAEAFLLHITKQGLEGDGAAARAAMAAIEQARSGMPERPGDQITCIRRVMVAVGSVSLELRERGMAVKLDALRPTARMRIEPWLVQAALARLGERRLTRAEQAEVVGATRTPGKVRWPEWWEGGGVMRVRDGHRPRLRDCMHQIQDGSDAA